MSGLSELLEVARRALMSQRLGMDVTSHNISNVNTLGYSRQRADFVATKPLQYSYGLLGTGVTVDHIGRLRDAFADRQIRDASYGLGKSTMEYNILSQVEAVLNEPSGTGLSDALSAFFNSFQDLSVHPEDAGVRSVVVQRTQALIDSFHTLHASLTDSRNNLVDEISSRVSTINSLTSEISKLDVQITNAKSSGLDPNDLSDQRDEKITELSKLADITVSEDNRGSVMVSIDGAVVASGAGAVALQATPAGTGMSITLSGSGRALTLRGGELGGILGMYNTTIPGYLDNLDQLANALVTRVNALHSSGYGLGNPPSTGIDLFTGTDAATIGLNSAVQNDVNLLAASGDGTVGNNAIALALANVGDDKIMNGNSVSINQFYSGMVSNVGMAVNSAKNAQDSASTLLDAFNQQQASVSGVSLDEEMVNMIKFQHAFDAAAKLVTTTDELFQTVIDMVQ